MKNMRKRIALASAALFIIVFALCAWYLRQTTTPMASHDISPASDPGRWRFALEDGTALEPSDGALPLTGTDAVVLCRTTLTEALSNAPYFVVTANHADCAIYLNDALVYAPSGRFSGGRFADSEYAPASASGEFIARLSRGGEDTLTMWVQLQGEDDLVKHLPRLTVYFDRIYYNSQAMATTAEAAFPAGMYFALALFLSGLFLIGAWKDRPDAGLTLLALCALSMALTSTTPYTVGVAWTLSWASVSIFCSILPLVAMGWTLWYRLSRRPRLCLLPVLGAVSAALLYYLVAGFGQSNTLNARINVLQIWVVPGAVLATLAVAAVDARAGNPWFRRFFRYLFWSVPAVAAAWGFSALIGGKLARAMAESAQRFASYHSLFKPCEQLCVLLLILMFIQAVVDLIAGLARRDAEFQTLSLREKYAAENVKLMLETQESTRRERHEMRHHVALLDGMLAEGRYASARDYVRALLDRVDALPSDAYSANPTVNAIVGRYLNDARAAGIAVTADIKTADSLPLRDDELCALLANMLENALEACLAMPEASERFIRFRLRATEDHMTVACENSTDAAPSVGADGRVTTSKADAARHGFGLPVMRRIAEKHGGTFAVDCDKERFTVKATI